MKSFEKEIFNVLTSQLGFYIKDYYSGFLGKKSWVAILEKETFIYAVVVADDNYCDYAYSEANNYLNENFSKTATVNVLICTDKENYYGFTVRPYNKAIYLSNKMQVVYSDESCKPLANIAEHIKKKNEVKRNSFKDNIVTYSLIIINILIFIITIIVSKNIYDIDVYTLVIMGAKVNELINHGQVWRLITCTFLHGGLAHIAFNMYALKIIGSEVEFAYGKIKYILIYLFSALGGSIFSYIFSPNSISVGASGAIFGLFGAMLVFGVKNRHRIGKNYVINLFKVVIINIFIGVTISNIDNAGHIGGLVAGGIIALLVKNKKLNN